MSWKKVKIGSFLKRMKEPVRIKDQDDYTLVTIRMYHKGVAKRSEVKGNVIKSSILYSIKVGQFILSGIDARNGAFGLVPTELNGAVVTNDFWTHDINYNLIDRGYFLWFTTTPQFYEACVKASEGTTNRQRLQADKFYDFDIWLPSLEEQKDLVKKINTINKRIENISNELMLQQSYLTQLRQSILQEAVQGKLTQQNPADEPAAKLLERIKAEKQQLIAAGKLKKEKPLPPITADEIPFELSKGWVWCRLGEIIELISGQHIEANGYNEKEVGVPYLTGPSDFGEINPVFSRWSENPKVLAQKNDILITVKGSGVGKLNLLHEDSVAIGRQLMAVRVRFLEKDFIKLFLESIFDQLQNQKAGIAIPGISREDILEKVFPLPSLSEQHRIVAKVRRLLQHISALEKQVQQSQTQSQQLLQAVLKEAFNEKVKKYKENDVVTTAAEE